MAKLRRHRWTALVVAVIAVAAPAGAERAQESEQIVECPGLQSPVGYDATNGASQTVMPLLTGDLVPYDEAGAEVTASSDFDESREPQRIYRFSVTYNGIASQLTTAPNDSGGNYPSRTPVPGETESGVISIVTQADGVYLSLQQASSGSANWFVWRIGPSCGPTTAPAPAPPAAEPVEGTSSTTG